MVDCDARLHYSWGGRVRLIRELELLITLDGGLKSNDQVCLRQGCVGLRKVFGGLSSLGKMNLPDATQWSQSLSHVNDSQVRRTCSA